MNGSIVASVLLCIGFIRFLPGFKNSKLRIVSLWVHEVHLSPPTELNILREVARHPGDSVFRKYIISHYPSTDLPSDESDGLPQNNQTEEIRKMIQEKISIFCAEAGARVAECDILELLPKIFRWKREFDWTGLVIQPNPNAINEFYHEDRWSGLSVDDCYCIADNATMVTYFKLGSLDDWTETPSQPSNTTQISPSPCDVFLSSTDATDVNFLDLQINVWELICMERQLFIFVDLQATRATYPRAKEDIDQNGTK